MTDQQLWLVYVPKPIAGESDMYISTAIPMEKQPGFPSVVQAILWLAHQHEVLVEQEHLHQAVPVKTIYEYYGMTSSGQINTSGESDSQT